MSGYATEWCGVDDWWKLAGSRDTELLSDLQALFEELSEQWRESPACFDRDPLCAEWRYDGPLRILQEENWSRWLAHLFQTVPASFITDVFDFAVTEPTDRVRCKSPLSSDSKYDRRADILI